MRLAFFAIPALHPEHPTEELNRFLGSHRVVRVERELVQAGAASFWAVTVEYTLGDPETPSPQRRPRIDYREVLDPADFALYSKPRELSTEVACADLLPGGAGDVAPTEFR